MMSGTVCMCIAFAWGSQPCGKLGEHLWCRCEQHRSQQSHEPWGHAYPYTCEDVSALYSHTKSSRRICSYTKVNTPSHETTLHVIAPSPHPAAWEDANGHSRDSFQRVFLPRIHAVSQIEYATGQHSATMLSAIHAAIDLAGNRTARKATRQARPSYGRPRHTCHARTTSRPTQWKFPGAKEADEEARHDSGPPSPRQGRSADVVVLETSAVFPCWWTFSGDTAEMWE